MLSSGGSPSEAKAYRGGRVDPRVSRLAHGRWFFVREVLFMRSKHVVASGRAGKWAGGRVRFLRLLIGLDGRLITVLERGKV